MGPRTPDLLPKLKSLLVPSGDHQFLLDSSPIAADVKIGGTWKTILVFGERRGGGYYQGNDVNPPDDGEFSPEQAIYAAANAAFDANRALWIYFGTGDRNHPNNAAANRFYGLKDETTMAQGSVYTEAPSPGTTTSGIVSATALTVAPPVGWYYTLNSTDREKILSSADIFNKIVYFTSFKPSVTASCGGTELPGSTPSR